MPPGSSVFEYQHNSCQQLYGIEYRPASGGFEVKYLSVNIKNLSHIIIKSILSIVFLRPLNNEVNLLYGPINIRYEITLGVNN
jgi:hypothetical protein